MKPIGGSLGAEALSMLSSDPDARMRHFWLLPRDKQIEAIQRLAASGMSDHGISKATQLSVEAVCRLLAEHGATRELFNAEGDS